MIPAIASFFGVSTDELFDFNIYEIEQRVDKIVDEHRQYLDTDVKKSEQIIRNGLKKYTGNEILLNCLINIISATDGYSFVNLQHIKRRLEQFVSITLERNFKSLLCFCILCVKTSLWNKF